MTDVYGTYAEDTFCHLELDGEISDENYVAFINDDQEGVRFLVEVNAVELTGIVGEEALGEVFAEEPYAELSGDGLTLGAKKYLFSDGMWIGKPSEGEKANVMAHARIITSADIERIIPVLPEGDRRGNLSLGDIQIANPDGAFDELRHKYTIAGRTIRIYIGRPTAEFREFKQIVEAQGQTVESDLNVIRLRIQLTQRYLDLPLQSRRYGGTGGIDGDPGLIERLVPVCLGECFNVSPTLINADQWIYQVHDGPIYRVDAFKDFGLPLEYQGDVTTFGALRATDVTPGYYLTCKTLGLIKAGFGLAGPAGRVTVDVKGDVSAGLYAETVGEILIRAAIIRARTPSSYLDLNSFDSLDVNPAGFYADGSQEYTVADLFNYLLQGVNGWYGATRSRLIKVSYLRPPEDFTAQRTISDPDILNIEELPIDPPSRYEQAGYYKKNWTPLLDTEVSLSLDGDTRLELQLPGKLFKLTSAEARVRNITSIRGETLDTFLGSLEAARDSISRIMTLHRETRRLFRVLVKRVGFLIDVDSIIKLKLTGDDYLPSRFGLTDEGKNFLVIGTRDSGKETQTELTLWG